MTELGKKEEAEVEVVVTDISIMILEMDQQMIKMWLSYPIMTLKNKFMETNPHGLWNSMRHGVGIAKA